MTVPSPNLACSLPTLALVLALTVTAAPAAADEVTAQNPIAAPTSEPATVCPVGVLKCPKRSKKTEYALCKRNDLLDFFVPGLPTSGDRGTVASDLSARKVSSTDAKHYLLEGEVQLQRLDQLVRADTLSYDTETTDYVADGHVRAQDRSMLMSADHAHGTGTPSTTYLDHVRYQMLEQRGNGTAATANMTDPDHGKLTDGTYTTCDPDDVRWHLHANDLDVDYVENEGHAHGATLYYGDVPFFWFPYLKFSLNDARESGFLPPHIGYSVRRGFVLGLPYYLNLAPNYDATIEPRVSTDRGAMLAGQFRFLDASDKAQFDFNYVPHDREVDEEMAQYAAQQAAGTNPIASPLDIPHSRWSYRLQDTSMFSQNWGAVIDLKHVSDKQYFQDYGDNLTSSATSLLPSSAYLNGRGEWWSATFGGDSAEVTQPYISEAFEPYERLPRGTFQAEHLLGAGFDAGVNAEYVNFRKSPFSVLVAAPNTFQRVEAIEGQRLDLYPYLAYPIETAGYFIRPEIGVRYTSYDLHNLADFARTNPSAQLFTNHTPTRSVPIFDVDAGLIFERPLHLFDSDFTQTLEPRLYYLRVPYRNQNDLPIFDTQLPTFDFPGLFRSNAFTGADRQSNANNLTLALTSRLIDSASGDQILSASLGQIHYFDAQRVQLPGYPEVDYSGSDYVFELDWRLNDRWDLKWDQQYNPNSRVFDPATAMMVENLHHTDLSAVSVEHRFGGDGVLNFSYRFRRGLLEQLDTTALVPLNARWSLVGRYYYSLMNRQLLEAFLGAQYDSCCVAMRVLVRRYVNAIGQLHADTGVFFELEFKGLGSTGSRTENFLRRAILGYE